MAHPKLWGTTDTRNGLPTTTRESPDFSHGECQKNIEVNNNFSDSKFYNLCCRTTMSKTGAGVLKNGVVSSSGYGDGVYSCYVSRNEERRIVAVKLVFIDVDEDEYEVKTF